MRMLILTTALGFVFGLVNSVHATLVFSLANTSDATFEHDSNGTNSPSPIPSAGSQSVGNGTFAWGNLGTDTTPNTAVFLSGAFTSSDWGGLGTFTSVSLDISTFDAVDIAGVFDGLFNSASEFSNFFYTLDGGSKVTFGAGTEDSTATNQAVSVSGLDVSAASSMAVGFEFNHNGGSDFFNVDSLTVNGTAVPEPSAFLFGSLICGVLGVNTLRRRRQTV